jgi:hypothetical protein
VRNVWWMAPVAVLLLLGAVAVGVWLGREAGNGAMGPAPAADAKVSAPVGQVPSGTAKPATAATPPLASKPAAPATPPAPPATEPQRPADADAVAFIDRLMQARMAGDAAGLKAMLAAGLNSGGIRGSTPEARITGYSTELLGSGDTDSFIFRVNVAFSTGQPGGEVAAENLRLSWRGGFKLAAFEDVARDALALGVGKDGKLVLSRGQNTAPVAELAALPAKAKPWGAAPGTEFGVGKEGWSVAAVSLTGNHVLWVTRGLHPLLGVSRVNWNGQPEVTPLDLLFEAGAVDAAWAPAGDRYVAVAVAQPSGATVLMVYDLVAGERLVPALPAGPDYSVRAIRWLSPQVVAFDLVHGGQSTGPWRFNVVSRSLQGP